MIKMILCTDVNNGIGNNNTIPWHSSADFKHFKNETIGGTIIMGYNTFASLDFKPLPNRVNIIINTKDTSIDTSNLKSDDYVLSIKDYSELQNFFSTNQDAIVIGGSKIYEECIKYCNVVIKSTIQGNYTCDRYFDIHEHGVELVLESHKKLEDGTLVEYFNVKHEG